MSNTTTSKQVQVPPAPGVGRYLPGLLVGVAGALLSQTLGPHVRVLNDVILAILLGFLLRNLTGWITLSAGLNFSVKYLLRAAIILLGLQLNLQQVASTGGQALWIILIVVAAAIPVVYIISRKLGLSPEMASLLGVGSAICGATAVLATGPIVRAKDQDMALAIATIFIFNTIALVLYPVLGHIWHMPDAVFGTWAGTAVQDVSSAVATGFAYSDVAGKVATVVKLTRTVLIVPVVFSFGLLFSTNQRKTAGASYVKIFPWFVLGFLAVVVLNSLGIFSTSLQQVLNKLDHILILMVMVGIGFGLNTGEMKKVGLTFLGVGLAGMTIMSVASLLLIKIFLWN